MICSIYIRPEEGLEEEIAMEKWLNQLDTVARNHENIILTGDLNAKHQMWYNNKANKLGERLSDFLVTNENNFLIINDESKTYKDSVIDLTMIKGCRNLIKNWVVDENIFVKTDHHMIRFLVTKEDERQSIRKWNTNKANWDLFKEKMGEKLMILKDDCVTDQNEMYNRIKSSFHESAMVSIPKLEVNGKHKGHLCKRPKL